MSIGDAAKIKIQENSEIQVNINHLGAFGPDEVYSFKSPSGRLEAIFTAETSVYKIGRLDVEGAPEEEGTALITTCYQHACDLNARTIVSTISSREYLETMRTALGSEYSNIQHQSDDDQQADSPKTPAVVELQSVAPAVE